MKDNQGPFIKMERSSTHCESVLAIPSVCLSVSLSLSFSLSVIKKIYAFKN